MSLAESTATGLAGEQRFNIASHLPRAAREKPDEPAVIAATGKRAHRYRSISYAELDRRSDAIAGGLCAAGMRRGDRVSVFVRPGIDLIAITFALFKAGAVPVLIDPGMGRARVLQSLEKIRPRVFIGIPAAQLARTLGSRAFKSVELFVTVGPRWFFGGQTLAALVRGRSDSFPCVETLASEEAAILFTSGSTGPPKGVVYTHGMFEAQVRALRSLYDIRPGEVDVACFPLFALFDVALSTLCVFPYMDAARPAACEPEHIVAAIRDHRATYSFGSPAIWRRVAPWCQARDLRLTGLKRVLIAGAPVPPGLIDDLAQVLDPDAEVHTPYGATEALPVTSIRGSEIRGDLRDAVEGGAGTCVGRPAPGIELRLIRITDEPIESFDTELELPRGELGEICVRGPVVTHAYKFEDVHTRAAKIREGATVWHRMGDLGYLDREGRLWFCGRKAHRLETTDGLITPVPVENVFNAHPGVKRTALVGVGPRGRERPTLIVETDGPSRHETLVRELLARGQSHAASRVVDSILFHPGFPVDARHNAKIHRLELKRWAEGRSGHPDPAASTGAGEPRGREAERSRS